MYFIFIWIITGACKRNPQIVITDSETEIFPVKDDVVYNIEPDGRGGVTVKTSEVNDQYPCPDSNMGANTRNILDNQANDYIIGYAPTPEKLMTPSSVPIYTVDEYRALVPNALPLNVNEYQGPTYASTQDNIQGSGSINGSGMTYFPVGSTYQASSNGAVVQGFSNGTSNVANSNGSNSNGFNSNGVISAGSNSNGPNTNGATLNGASANGASANGTSSNGASANGKSSNGSSTGSAIGADTDKKSGSDSKGKKCKKDKKTKENKKSDRDSETVASGVDQISDLLYLACLIDLL